ncbi:MAG: hypothetical protein ABEI98_07795 [Halorhabdus sp.]
MREGWSTPPGRGQLTPDGDRYRLTWHPSSTTRKVALFRVVTDDRVAVLQHVRTVRVQQRGDSFASTDPDAEIEDIPWPLLAAMEADGVTPARSECGELPPEDLAGSEREVVDA